MRFFLTLFFCCILFFANSQETEKRFSIVRLNNCAKIDTAYDNLKKNIIATGKREIFLIRNYNPKDSIILDKYVNSYVRKERDRRWRKKYTDYAMAFYKLSNDLNISAIAKDPQVFWKRSQELDLIYYYLWTDNKFYGIEKHHSTGSKFSVKDVDQ